jgi:sec-independent protein translocase protein TatC
VFLGAFVVAAVLTPPDVTSQILLALPMYLLFEIGLFVARRLYRQRAAAADEHRALSESELDAMLDTEDKPAGRKSGK